MAQELTDWEKQQLLVTFYLNKIRVPGLDRLALRIAESVADERERQSAMLTLSNYLAAYRNLPLADEIARKRLDGYASASALAKIGCELAKDDPTQAISYLREAEALLEGICDSDEQAIVLQQVSRGYSHLNRWQAAKDAASRIPRAEDKVSSLCEIATDLWSAGEVDVARRMLSDAQALVKETELIQRTSALNDVAKVLVQMNRLTEAAQVWDEAITFAKDSTDPSKWLFSICEKLVSIGNRERAREVAALIENEARKTDALSLVNSP